MTLFISLWMSIFGLCFHPVYVSVLNMDIDQSRKEVTMSLKIFTDDLETILHNKYNIDGWIGTPREHKDCRKLISEYIDERLKISINQNEELILVKDSMKIFEDAFWIFMKCTANQKIKTMEITNRVLTDFFYSQTNLVIISTGKDEKGHKLDRKKYKIELSL